MYDLLLKIDIFNKSKWTQGQLLQREEKLEGIIDELKALAWVF